MLEYAARRRADPAPDIPLQPGRTVLGKYDLGAVLGRGSQGTAFLARDTVLARDVVLKILPGHGQTASAILKEARALARVRSRHVVAVYDADRVADQVFVVMEHMPGGSLAQRLASAPANVASGRRLAHDLLAALADVHAAGILHRDVKPSNVLFDSNGAARLADFGIATDEDAAEATQSLVEGPPVGSLRYMAPEVARGQGATERSDLYSAAATLAEALSGRPVLAPIPGETATELRIRVAAAGRWTDAVPDEPKLTEWLARALEAEPAARYESAQQMRDAMPPT